MLHILLRWLLTALAIVLVSYIVPGFNVDGMSAALIAALVIGLINATLGFALKIMTFPLTLLTLGLFWLVINALMIMLASRLLDGFHVDGFLSAFFGAIVLSLANMVLQPLAKLGKN